MGGTIIKTWLSLTITWRLRLLSFLMLMDAALLNFEVCKSGLRRMEDAYLAKAQTELFCPQNGETEVWPWCMVPTATTLSLVWLGPVTSTVNTNTSPSSGRTVLGKSAISSFIVNNAVLISNSICVHACSVPSVVLSLYDPMECNPPGSSVHGIL